MNKRIKKKNNIVRINDMLIEAIILTDKYKIVYARLVGRKNLLNADIDFGNGYDKWNKSILARRTWKYMLKTNNLPKFIGYKNKTIKT